MKDASLLEKILGKFLSREQIVALVEEISKGVSVVNGIIDKNEKIKAQKEFVFETFRSIDRMIAQSNKIPATFKLFYDTAKVKIHDLLEPIITGMVMENDFSDLDDIPDVKKNDVVQKRENTARPQESSQQQANGGEQQGGRRRRNRRHGRNRNNNQNQEQQKPVETSHETSQKPEPKPVQTSHETSLPTESKPEPAKKPAGRGRTQKKPAEKPESVQKPEPKPVQTFHETSLPTESKPEPAKKPARRGRTPKKPKETNE
jgi:uncharacterized protein YfkK (UPF0435 family)